MILSINTKQELLFRYENTKHKLGMQIWGDRRSFLELHQLLHECWECKDDTMSDAEGCSHTGVISYFSYTVRHAFMGDRWVKLDGKPVKVWSDEMFQLFEKEQERFEVGMDFSWPQMLFIMASWWECLKQKECPVRVLPVMREFTENIERLLRERSKLHYSKIEPYVHGAIYAANPYLMHTMEHINAEYLAWTKVGRPSLDWLADRMTCASYGNWRYEDYMAALKRQAKKHGCPIEELKVLVDDSVYDIEL